MKFGVQEELLLSFLDTEFRQLCVEIRRMTSDHIVHIEIGQHGRIAYN